MAAAGHHSYTLKDNHIADLGTRQYIRDMVIYIYMNDSKNFEMYKSIMIDLIWDFIKSDIFLFDIFTREKEELSFIV